MLLYLAANPKPDLAFAVNQADRYTHNTCQTHEEAIKQICQYLQGTIDKGLILSPSHF